MHPEHIDICAGQPCVSITPARELTLEFRLRVVWNKIQRNITYNERKILGTNSFTEWLGSESSRARIRKTVQRYESNALVFPLYPSAKKNSNEFDYSVPAT